TPRHAAARSSYRSRWEVECWRRPKVEIRSARIRAAGPFPSLPSLARQRQPCQSSRVTERRGPKSPQASGGALSRTLQLAWAIVVPPLSAGKVKQSRCREHTDDRASIFI